MRKGSVRRVCDAWRAARAGMVLAVCAAAAPLALAASPAAAEGPLRIKIAGGLAGLVQFKDFEEPFWTKRIEALSGGRIEASIRPYDKSGLRAQDMLQLVRLGVVPWGTLNVSAAAADEPEINAIDLPMLNPDIGALKKTVSAFRPRLKAILAERHGIELLGVYAYPAQVIYCKNAFTGLSDLAGRRVRTSSVAQSEFVAGLGGVGVITPFAETLSAMQKGVVDCAITGTLSGNEIGLPTVATHIHAMAVSWGVTAFVANAAAWNAVPDDLKAVIRDGVAELEADIWTSAERETVRGLACNTGGPGCDGGRPGAMILVPTTLADEAKRRQLLVATVLPSWVDRCGQACVESWNATLAPVAGAMLATQ